MKQLIDQDIPPVQFEHNKYQPNIENLEQNRMESNQPEKTSKIKFKPGKLDCCE